MEDLEERSEPGQDPGQEPGQDAGQDLEPSSTGIEPRLAGTLAYLLGFITGIVFLVVEKRSTYVRFHAMQSTMTFVSLMVIQVVGGAIPVLGPLVTGLASLVGLVVWVLMMLKAFQGERYKLPWVGDVAEERSAL